MVSFVGHDASEDLWMSVPCHMLRSCCQLTVGSMGFDRFATTWGALDLTLSDTAAVQGAQSTLGLLGLITPLWLSVV